MVKKSGADFANKSFDKSPAGENLNYFLIAGFALAILKDIIYKRFHYHLIYMCSVSRIWRAKLVVLD